MSPPPAATRCPGATMRSAPTATTSPAPAPPPPAPGEGAAGGGPPPPGAPQYPLEQGGGSRAGDLPDRGPTPPALPGRGHHPGPGGGRLLPDRGALGPQLVRPERAVGLPQRPQLRRLLDGVGQPGQGPDRKVTEGPGDRGAPRSGVSASPGPRGKFTSVNPGSTTAQAIQIAEPR